MRISQLFGKTLRETPAEAQSISHKLLMRAGFIRTSASGFHSLLPLGRMAIRHIEDLIQEQMAFLSGQEIRLPMVIPTEMLNKSSVVDLKENTRASFQDKIGSEFTFLQSPVSVVADLVKNEIHSYRQLPAIIYQIQSGLNVAHKPNGGLERLQERTTLRSYSLDRDQAGLESSFELHSEIFKRVFSQCDLPVIFIPSFSGKDINEEVKSQFVYPTPVGDETIFFCNQCDYAANLESAVFQKRIPPVEKLLEIQKVATPGIKSIEELSTYLKIGKEKTAKAVFFVAYLANLDQTLFVFTLLRGDTNVNESKLSRAISQFTGKEIIKLRSATDDEIVSIGAIPGYASPLFIKRDNVLLIADDLIPLSANLVAGANISGYHLLNVNYERDFTADLVTDIAAVEEGSICPICSGVMYSKKAIEVGQLRKIGTLISEKTGCSFLTQDRSSKFVNIGSYKIDLERLLVCIAEAHHDENGLIWPITIAPFPVHLIMLPSKNSVCQQFAENLYKMLCDSNLCPLFDDRDERPGVKFNDADLIGLPIRITVSERTIANDCVEFKRRDQKDKREVQISEIISTLKADIKEMKNGLGYHEH